MKKALIPILIILAVLFVGFMIFQGSNNKMVDLDEDVTASWANVETQYQRRADLIPNLVSTVKGYADHEKSTLEAVVNARARATQTTIDPSNMTLEQMQEFQSAQGELSSALSRLLVTVESYPDLKANQNFLALQSQLEGTENRISVARDRFNGVATTYNKYIRKVPQNILAGMLGFDKRPLFEADPGSQVAPKVSF